MSKRRCIALYSGGLDSILAIKVIQQQDIDVIPIYFCTPFFGFDTLKDPESFRTMHAEKYGIDIQVIDFTDDMIRIIDNPHHGFGKHLNPCIDCKIGMLKRAKMILEEREASFVITGEVLGQRPMSQRRQIMRAIEKESGLVDLLLRPLCARNLEETLPERLGIVKREELWELTGRGRKIQIERAHAFDIKKEDIPTPAGGCLLTDRRISQKVSHTFGRCSPSLPDSADIMLDVVGRKFILGASTVLMVSRDEGEGELISTIRSPRNVFLKILDVPGPLCILRGEITKEKLETAAGICLRYAKTRGVDGQVAVYGEDPYQMSQTVEAPVFSIEQCKAFHD
jgi:tRNA-uridine 2-sulfurtransferase